jgi:hypothetical protein
MFPKLRDNAKRLIQDMPEKYFKDLKWCLSVDENWTKDQVITYLSGKVVDDLEIQGFVGGYLFAYENYVVKLAL